MKDSINMKEEISEKSSMVSDVISLWMFLGKKRIWQLTALFILMSLSIVSEMVSLGAVVPFLGALTNSEMLMKQSWFQPVVSLLEIKSADELLLPLTIAFIMAAVFSAGLRILLLWVNTRLSASMAIQLRSELYKRALYKSYEFHLTNNSSELISIITEKIGAASAAILHLIMFVIAIFTSLAIIMTMMVINPVVAIVTFCILGGGYFIIGYFSRKVLERNSVIAAENQPLSIKQLQEGIGGIRDVILDNTQEEFLKNYIRYAQKVHIAASNNAFISQLPKSILELIGIVLIASLAYYLNSQGQSALPILGAMAMGSQRLLPSLQQAYYSWSTIIGAQAAISDVVSYLDIKSDYDKKISAAIDFEKNIALEHIYFKYLGTETYVLDDVSLEIPKGARIGFMGSTGSGKSTLLDIIMGLLTPTKGRMLIDGKEINDTNIQSWRKHIAHVPQSIYLSDASILENIAFGVPREQIDEKRVIEAAKQAQLHQFIEELPQGYDTFVGERGVQLSGGQRQRIGIARALYKQTSVIVLDEATSALDNKTEEAVMEAVNSLDRNLTVFMVAHRLSTLKSCDVVYKLSHGKIIERGSYEEMCLQEEKVK